MLSEILNPSSAAVAIAAVLAWWLLTRRPSEFPPGPSLLPFLGNALSMSLDTRATFRKLRRQFGDIYSVYVFNQPIIVLNGYDVLRDALVKNADVFSDRPHSFLSDHLLRRRVENRWRLQVAFDTTLNNDMIVGTKTFLERFLTLMSITPLNGVKLGIIRNLRRFYLTNIGIVGTSGRVWREQRMFAVNTLKEFGVGRPLLEHKITEEIKIFLDVIARYESHPMDCLPLVGGAVANIICSVMFGKRFDYEDISFRRVLRCMDENVASFGSASILNVLPLVRYLPGDVFKFKRILSNLAFTEDALVRPSIEEHMMRKDDICDDFISAYIVEMRHRQHQKEGTTMNVENLQSIILDIFGTGSETIATTIRWALVYFLNYPDVQERCFQEIKETIGLNRSPCMKDKTSLPYLEATITEVLRHANIVPAGVPHTVPRDIKFRGYTIPQGVLVLPVLDSVLHDPDVWGDPEIFRPGRFLDENGVFVKREEFIPFSLGRRVCLGETLSRMELYLFLAFMLQRFRFLCAEDGVPSLDAVVGIVHSPKPFLLKVVSRH